MLRRNYMHSYRVAGVQNIIFFPVKFVILKARQKCLCTVGIIAILFQFSPKFDSFTKKEKKCIH